MSSRFHAGGSSTYVSCCLLLRKNKSIIALLLQCHLKLLWYCEIHNTFSPRTCKRQWVPKETTDKANSQESVLACISTGARLAFIWIILPLCIMEKWRYIKKVQEITFLRTWFWKSYFTRPNCLSVLNHKLCNQHKKEIQ